MAKWASVPEIRDFQAAAAVRLGDVTTLRSGTDFAVDFVGDPPCQGEIAANRAAEFHSRCTWRCRVVLAEYSRRPSFLATHLQLPLR